MMGESDTTESGSANLPTISPLLTNQGSMATDCGSWEMALYVELAKEKDIRQFANKVAYLIRQLGFSDYSFMRMALKSCAEINLWTTPPEIPCYYQDQEIWEHDFMLQYATVNTKPIYQSAIDTYIASAPFETPTITKNKQIQKFVKGLGFLDYYNIPMPSANGNGNVLLSVTTRFQDPIDFRRNVVGVKDKLAILCRAIDHITTSKFPGSFLDPYATTALAMGPKPLLILSALASDLTLAQAAEKLKVSQKTANKHIARARYALGTKTTSGAIYKALQLGLLNNKK